MNKTAFQNSTQDHYNWLCQSIEAKGTEAIALACKLAAAKTSYLQDLQLDVKPWEDEVASIIAEMKALIARRNLIIKLLQTIKEKEVEA